MRAIFAPQRCVAPPHKAYSLTLSASPESGIYCRFLLLHRFLEVSITKPPAFCRGLDIIRVLLYEWIFSGIQHADGLVEADILDTEVTEEIEQELSIVTECYCAVVRIALFNQNVTVEATHLRNCEDTDTAEGTSRNIKDLTLCDVCAELSHCKR